MNVLGHHIATMAAAAASTELCTKEREEDLSQLCSRQQNFAAAAAASALPHLDDCNSAVQFPARCCCTAQFT